MHTGKLPCHGGAAPHAKALPAGPCIHGTACGHVARQLPISALAVLTPRTTIAWSLTVATVAIAERSVVEQAGPEPATGPPRA